MSARVLVVDDSDFARALVVRVLRQAGFEVLEAGDGVEGAVQAFRQLPSVVLTDLEMPTMDGNQLLRLLKSDPATRAIPVIILTSHGEAPSRFWGLATGADAYITKGAAPEELLAVVHRLVRNGTTTDTPGSNLTVGPMDVLARVARTLDRELMKTTLTSSLLSQGMGTPDLVSACRRLMDLLKKVVDADIFAVGLAEAHTVSLYVNSTNELPSVTLDAINKALLQHLPTQPGAEVELTYDCDHAALSTEKRSLPLHYLSLPLREAEGLLAIRPTDPTTFDNASKPLLEELTGHIALILDNARLAQRLRELSSLDSLTRLLNHRAILERLAEELARARRRDQTVTVILCDFDHFKDINDSYGHLAGDAVLRAASQLFRKLLRASDALGRYGGEEFLIVLPETGLDAGVATAERMRHALERLATPLGEERTVRVTASFGVAAAGEMGESVIPDALIALADKRLYQAKAAGRNCVKP